jgi:NADH:ubiquinone oxidoreductase subunit F (NADH-binding)/NADH:ubiquinone oxidoreductase subunit E/NAD-dependent dihydropyrimidine dehydrogenase PreA subunit
LGANATSAQLGIDLSDIDAILETTGRERKDTVAILSKIQDTYHFLPKEALRRIAQVTDITPADLEGVSSFYSRFRREPAGLHTVRVCVGTACFVKGGENIYDAFRVALRISEGADTDPDGLFTVEKAACLGCCMLAPVAQIDDAVYGHLTRQIVPSVISDFLASRGAVGDPEASGLPGNGGRRASNAGPRGVVSLCTCTSCRASGALEVFEAFARESKELRLPVDIRRSACTGISYRAPVVEVAPPKGEIVRYAGITPADAREILFRHFRAPSPALEARRRVTRLLDRLMDGEAREPVGRMSLELARGPDGAFWGPQVRFVTSPTGADPLDFDGYAAAGGFEALRRCLAEIGPDALIDVIRESGLRGRGGAGYPTVSKWEAVRAAPNGPKVVICNADEGDPGAFMDRLLLESFPFRVIEGMAIAAYAVGAEAGLFFVRAEYPLALTRIRKAIDICRARGVVGRTALGFPFALQIEVAEGAGAFVCGEETAMIAALEGRRGTPRARPPYPAEKGLWGRPTLVNNVETLAAVPLIVTRGPRAFRASGTPGSPGTKTFALAGKIARGGLIEVPMGMSIRQIVEDIGGGIQGGSRLKAVQIGGPSGGCIPEWQADLPVDYERLAEAGAMMGSGGLVVLDESDCMVDIACYFTGFTQRESCGKCTCCRVGTRRMHELLLALCEGRGRPGDLELLEDLATAMREGSLCGLGRTAPNPVLSTLRHFRNEYEEHLQGRCPAGRCKALISYTITESCIGCTRCAQQCPSRAIAARPYERHVIDDTLCTRCGTCRQTCPSEAVEVTTRARPLTLGVAGGKGA